MPKTMTLVPKGYDNFLTELKDRIRHAQLRAALSVNHELVLLYWSIGKDILGRQKEQGWGAKVIDRLALDLHKAFPEMTGFSPRNLKYMRAFAEAWPGEQFVQQVAAQIPWFHNCVLLDRIKGHEEREWYIRQTIENGWSRNVLVHQIESGLYRRQGKALTNFTRTLPAPQSELAQQIVKDPYNFDFLMLGQEAQERELERGLLDHIRDFLIELGVGFAFVGSQYPLLVGGEEFRIDLLFYHLKLRAFGHRSQDGGIQDGIWRKNELLSFGSRRHFAPSIRSAEHRNHPLQVEEQNRGGIRSTGSSHASRRF